MTEQERPLIDRVWEFTKDLSVKVSRKAEKHWKINTLRVEIASIKHRINVKYKELGRYVFQSLKSGTLEEEDYKSAVREYFDELTRLENEISDREHRIEVLEQEMSESPEEEEGETPPSETEAESEAPEEPPPPPPKENAEKPKPPPKKKKAASGKDKPKKPKTKK